MSDTFSKETKNDLCGIYLKKPCCKRAFLYGALSYAEKFSRDGFALCTENEKFAELFCKLMGNVFHVKLTPVVGENMTVTDPDSVKTVLDGFGYTDGESLCVTHKENFVCDGDLAAYLRGMFLSCGTVTEPDVDYHLELMTQSTPRRENLSALLAECGLEPKILKRRCRREATLYYKDSSAMEDFLNFIGAQKAAFRLMDLKILRDIRNNANRLANCDTANIDKTVTAAQEQMNAIYRISEQGRLEELPIQLRQTFDLRAANPDATLTELAALHNPPLSKSGVSHRLSKLVTFARQTEKAGN